MDGDIICVLLEASQDVLCSAYGIFAFSQQVAGAVTGVAVNGGKLSYTQDRLVKYKQVPSKPCSLGFCPAWSPASTWELILCIHSAE